MRRANETEVLVVGAGPAGLLTALVLAQKGIRVTIIDKEERTATHSYACVLHPATLGLLDRLGLMAEIRPAGRLIDRAAFYGGTARQAEINFSEFSGDFHYALALPQSDLEQILERRLNGINNKVLWNHRLADLQFEEKSVVASIDKLVQTAKGYSVAEWDWAVQKRLETTAMFVVGADGHDSMVRSRLAIDEELIGGPEQFAVFEFNVDRDPGTEVRIAMDDTTTNVLWPLPGQRCRWTFQLVKTTDAGEFPLKDRERLQFADEKSDERMKHVIERLAGTRAPWFKNAVKSIEWAARIRFEHRLAKQFGSNCTWLAGDAAHQTSPVGGQSMNEGLLEAADLAGTMKRILRDGAPRQLLQEYNDLHRIQWEQLLNRDGGLNAKSPANTWLRDLGSRILSCVPATGGQFAQAIGQLGFEFETAGTPS